MQRSGAIPHALVVMFLVVRCAGAHEAATGGVDMASVRMQRAAEITSANHKAVLSELVTPAAQPTSEFAVSTLKNSSATPESYNNATEATPTSSSSTEVTSIASDVSLDHVSSSVGTESATTETSTSTTTDASTTTSTTTTTITTTTVATTTSQASSASPGVNSDEYFADDHGADSEQKASDSIGDESSKSEVVPANGSSTEKAMEQTTRLAGEFASRASVAVGRVLAQEESVPWPEAKSTKVIGTIIEDVPYRETIATLTGSAITAIVLSAFLVVLATTGATGYWWYRRRYLNRPETLNDRYAGSETGGNGDDIFRVGYIHSPEMPRDSSEEMYSLDNDSFLTSLEAMTIPTYWTETIKHTKL